MKPITFEPCAYCNAIIDLSGPFASVTEIGEKKKYFHNSGYVGETPQPSCYYFYKLSKEIKKEAQNAP